jgi:hypothetical protein
MSWVFLRTSVTFGAEVDELGVFSGVEETFSFSCWRWLSDFI